MIKSARSAYEEHKLERDKLAYSVNDLSQQLKKLRKRLRGEQMWCDFYVNWDGSAEEIIAFARGSE